MIRYTCNGCGSLLESDDRMAGQTERCPACGLASKVPWAKVAGEGAIPEPLPMASPCFFCGSLSAVQDRSVYLCLWRQGLATTQTSVKGSSHAVGGKAQIEWRSVAVPRCAQCAKQHGVQSEWRKALLCGVAMVLCLGGIAGSVYITIAHDGTPAWVWTLLSAGALLGITGRLMCRIAAGKWKVVRERTIRPERHKVKYSVYTRMLADGWRRGKWFGGRVWAAGGLRGSWNPLAAWLGGNR